MRIFIGIVIGLLLTGCIYLFKKTAHQETEPKRLGYVQIVTMKNNELITCHGITGNEKKMTCVCNLEEPPNGEDGLVMIQTRVIPLDSIDHISHIPTEIFIN